MMNALNWLLVAVYFELLEMEPLGDEFAQVLADNLWDLYQE
jgi:hypothetical protein